jgi:hypothetical protein
MRHGTATTLGTPARTCANEAIDSEVVEFRQAFESRSVLDDFVREGARQMLQAAIEAEVDGFLVQHADRRDALWQASGCSQWTSPFPRTPHGSRLFGSEAAAGARQLARP